MNSSVSRVITTSTPGCFSSSFWRRSATSSVSSASETPFARAPGSWPPWPASITMRDTPSPSWRDSENLPFEFAAGASGESDFGTAGFDGSGATSAAGGAGSGGLITGFDSSAGAFGPGRDTPAAGIFDSTGYDGGVTTGVRGVGMGVGAAGE